MMCTARRYCYVPVCNLALFNAKLLIDVIKSHPRLRAQAYFHCFEGAGAPGGGVLMRDG